MPQQAVHQLKLRSGHRDIRHGVKGPEQGENVECLRVKVTCCAGDGEL